MTGVVLPDRLPIFGDGHPIDRFVPVVPSPAGALLDAVGAIGQGFGDANAILADGDDVAFGSPLRPVIAAGGLEAKPRT